MTGNEMIRAADLDLIEVVRYPDPHLREVCAAVEDASASEVSALVERMFARMFAQRGVGLAAPQVGVPVRLFIASPTFEPDDRRVYVNPEILDAESQQDGEEGCLSFPGIYSRIKRHNVVTLRAQGLDGEWFEETGTELTARIFEHESDHLEGRLLVDRMGSVSKLAHRKALRELESRFAEAAR